MTEANQEATFQGLGIAPRLLEILEKNKYTVPTPIQMQAIPIGLSGADVIGIAQTGTGKTMAFGIPMIQRMVQMKTKGLVVLPTRELAVQVDENLAKIGRGIGLKTAILIGGESMPKQIRQLRDNPHVIIATPGRLIDHLEQKTATLKDVGILVLDEADRMLDMGFEPQIKRILENVPKERQTMLFSATMPEEIIKIAAKHMKSPTRIEVAPPGTTAQRVSQEMFFVDRNQKPELLKKLMEQYAGPTLVFLRTKHGAKKLTTILRRWGQAAAEIHSNRSISQRLEALNGFKNGKYRVLVATDIAARGIDVNGIELVVNFDLPQSSDDYVHRIGRTARAGKKGHAVSFATPDQRHDVRDIERIIKQQIPLSKTPELPRFIPDPADDDRGPRPERGGSSRFGGGRGGDRGGRPAGNSRGGFSGGSRGPAPRGDRPSFGSDRPARPPYGDRPARPSFGDRSADRPARPAYGDRPARPGYGDRGARPAGGSRFGGGRPERSNNRGGYPGSDRGPRDAQQSERPAYDPEKKGPFSAPKSKRDRKRFNDPVKLPSWFKGLRTSEKPTWLTLKDL